MGVNAVHESCVIALQKCLCMALEKDWLIEVNNLPLSSDNPGQYSKIAMHPNGTVKMLVEMSHVKPSEHSGNSGVLKQKSRTTDPYKSQIFDKLWACSKVRVKSTLRLIFLTKVE